MKTLNEFVGHHYAPGAAPGWGQSFSDNLATLSLTMESFSALLCGMALLYLVLARTNRRAAAVGGAGSGELIRDLERETRMRAFRDIAFELRLRQSGGHTEY